jgi:hypothetical protein
MTIRANLRDGPYEWLIALLLSWWIPLQLFGTFTVKYWVSLLLWLVPVLLLFPRFLRNTHRGSRRRRALLAAASYIFLAGLLLDFAFGALILNFDNCPSGKYLACLPALGGRIPIEEYLFYILGGFAVVLVYVWADMHWLAAYNVRKRRELLPLPGHLIEWSPRVALTATMALAAGLLWRVYHLRMKHAPIDHWWTTIPIYYTFLMVFAFLPLVVMYRGVVGFINWRAFSFTALYVFLTAAIWEVTLALPESWWTYQTTAMIGKNLDAWSRIKIYPIEALFVWIAVVFIGVFFYEFWETYYYDQRPPMVKLFRGGFPVPPAGGAPAAPLPPGISVVIRDSGDLSQRLRFLAPASATALFGVNPFEVLVAAAVLPDDLPGRVRFVRVEDAGAWRAAGAGVAEHPILCFVDRGLTAAPRVFREIAAVIESPRVVGGSTSAVPEAPLLTRFGLALLAIPKAWISVHDRGVVFCRRADFFELPIEAQHGGQDRLLDALREYGSHSKRVLTRVVTDGVTERR